MSRTKTAQELLGELIIMGLEGKTLSDETSAFLQQAKIGGVIYFSKNYESPTQIAQLSEAIQESSNALPLWISVDHEGGRVQRFRAPFTIIPEATDLTQGYSPKRLFDISQMIARELRAVGVNLNFAPVADIHSNEKNPVIGKRSFGTEEDTVSKMVSAFVRGHVKEGVFPCLKHFPGHGDTSVDSHFELPLVERTPEELAERELKPFIKGIRSGCRMIMTAHILNPHLDPKYPATLSPFVLQNILREELRYNGLIVSDDMDMHAITKNYSSEVAPVLAVEAGCDLLIYRTEESARKGYQALFNALESGKLDPERVIESAERSQEAKADFLADYSAKFDTARIAEIGSEDHQLLLKP